MLVSMILTRAPLRISIAGGGTDFPDYYLGRGAKWISAAIKKYCYTSINDRFSDDFLIKYSRTEQVSDIDEITHPLIRTALQALPPSRPIELTFSADLPGGTGLGSSASFLVSLLEALHLHRNENRTPDYIAQEATEIEMNILKEPIGLQDQYISSIGGVTEFKITEHGEISWEHLPVPQSKVNQLFRENFLLLFTGYKRESRNILTTQKNLMRDKKSIVIEQLDYVGSKVEEIKNAIILNDAEKCGKLFDDHWMFKKLTNENMSNSDIDEIYKVALKGGAFGGKLIGAGGGGFLLFVTSDKRKLREELSNFHLSEILIDVDYLGVTTVINE
jgi:D-glycero-alpha-D-manno-heptose-7-phosphate kinase